MGIDKSAASVLVSESKRIPFRGSVLQLGRQDITFDFETLQKIFKQHKHELTVPSEISLNIKEIYATKNFIGDKCFFSAYGFTNVLSLDFSNYESADIVFNLNESETPINYMNSFDVIIDGGTIEHVFHIPNVMKNITNMLKVGGRIIHFSPSSNFVDHGFYMFSPTFFNDYYSSNKFEINTIQFFRLGEHENDPWEFYNYSPRWLNPLSFADLGGASYGVLCIATKTLDSTNDTIPQQGSYLQRWASNNPNETDHTLNYTDNNPNYHNLKIKTNNIINKMIAYGISLYLYPLKMAWKLRNYYRDKKKNWREKPGSVENLI
jgi:SAM-dependent methyltransferase